MGGYLAFPSMTSSIVLLLVQCVDFPATPVYGFLAEIYRGVVFYFGGHICLPACRLY